MRNLAPSPIEQMVEEARAEELLARMDLQEDLADLWATERCEFMRRNFAEMYQKAIGIHPAQQEDLRIMLEMVQQGELARVADILIEFQSDVD
ncbi:MAG: hypothetical protein KDA80_05985 [Planctomycetaceae bacterium]|nr:hypothetical protein [Planctomycetaceae bacterium]